MTRPALPFTNMMSGRFSPDSVRVELTGTPRLTSPALEALIAEEWVRRVDEAKRQKRVLFNGEMLRYVGHRISDDTSPKTSDSPRLELIVGPTCYRDFVGTNLYNNRRVDEFGWDSFSNPVGTTATLITRDGRICYGLRSMSVGYHGGYVHTFGGALEPSDRDASGAVDVFDSVRRELHEEVGLRADEAATLVCVGLIRDTEILQPELLFEAAIPLSFAELRDRWTCAEARNEHVDLVALADAPDAIVPFIKACGKIAPVAVGALMLHGRARWGQNWYDRAAGELT